MDARGPHDDLDDATAVVVAALEAINRGDVEAAASYVDESLEHVTRDGVVHGPGRLLGEFSTQLDKWAIGYTLDELIDAGDGALIALLEVERRGRQTGELDWRAWPAIVVRVHGGKVVFLEGYVDRRRAMEALGVAVER